MAFCLNVSSELDRGLNAVKEQSLSDGEWSQPLFESRPPMTANDNYLDDKQLKFFYLFIVQNYK